MRPYRAFVQFSVLTLLSACLNTFLLRTHTQTHGVRYSAVPSMHLAIVQHAERTRMRTGEVPHTKLKFARNCSAALSPAIAARLENVLECPVLATCVPSSTSTSTTCFCLLLLLLVFMLLPSHLPSSLRGLSYLSISPLCSQRARGALRMTSVLRAILYCCTLP